MTRRGRAIAWFAAAAAIFFAALPAQAAETVKVRAAQHEGFGRIAFDWPEPVEFEARIEGQILTVHFARPLEAKLGAVAKYLDAYVASVTIGADGASIVAELKHPAKLHTFVEGKVIAVDIRTEPGALSSTAAPAKADVDKPTAAAAAGAVEVPIRFVVQPSLRRVVFHWHEPTEYSFIEQDGSAQLRFNHDGKFDTKRLAAALPGLAPMVTREDGAAVVTLTPKSGLSFRHRRIGNNIVLDVVGKPDVEADKPAIISEAPPTITPPLDIEPAAGSPGEASPDGAKAPPRIIGPQASGAPPPGALRVRAALVSQGASLRFDWQKPTAAAVFRRGGSLWLVFAGAQPLDLAELKGFAPNVISSVEQLPDAKATVLRVVARQGINPSVSRIDTGWVIELRPQEARPEAPIAVEARPTAATPDLFFIVRDAGVPVFLHDPEVGDILAVVPVGEVGRGVGAAPESVDVQTLPSVQGIALRPKADDLQITRLDDGVDVTRPGGLLLSGAADRDRRGGHDENGHRFDFAAWQGPADQSFLDKRSAREQAVAATAPSQRTKPRLALARFYFANLYAAEAAGVLSAIQHDDPSAAGDPQVVLLSGAVHLMAGDRNTAAQELGQKTIDGEPETALWRASLAAETGDWAAAAPGFAASVDALPRYPKPLRDHFALQAAEAFLETGQAAAAEAMIQTVLATDPPANDKAMALYLDGRRALAEEDYPRAMALWDQVAEMDDRPSRARARFARTMAQLDAGRITRADAIKALDQLRFAWRGDMIEFTLLKTLGQLKLAEGDQRGAFDVLRDAISNFPDYPQSKELMKQVSDGLADALLDKPADSISPVKALALYEEFKDFAPVGERGDAIVRRLIDRLVSVDLLDRAAALLEEQVNHRLAGRDKTRGATQLALLRLLDHHPADALKALEIDVGKDMPPDLLRQRQQLRARALFDLDRSDEALALLANDSSRDADRLRADIFWRTRNWPEAAKVLSHLVPVLAPDAKLDQDTSRIVLNWAAALTLAGDQKGLDELRAGYGKAMATTPFGDAFRVVAGDGASSAATTDPRAIASRVAQVSELQSFMANYKVRLAKDKLSAIN